MSTEDARGLAARFEAGYEEHGATACDEAPAAEELTDSEQPGEVVASTPERERACRAAAELARETGVDFFAAARGGEYDVVCERQLSDDKRSQVRALLVGKLGF